MAGLRETKTSLGSGYWLICDASAPEKVFVFDDAGLGRSLPVFSFREEAELFLALGEKGGRWRTVEKRTGDFLALFFGPCAGVESVVLDPLPTMLRDSTVGLIGLSLERFMDRFLGFPDLNGVLEPG